MNQTIHVDLGNVSAAINELNAYKARLQTRINAYQERVAERLKSLIQSGFNGASASDVLPEYGGPIPASVLVSIDHSGSITTVFAFGEDAIYVEFGAGVYHNGAVGSSRNPYGMKTGFTIGSHSPKGHASQDVWSFFDGTEYKKTHGTEAVMPMANAMSRVIQELPSIAKEVFG